MVVGSGWMIRSSGCRMVLICMVFDCLRCARCKGPNVEANIVKGGLFSGERFSVMVFVFC